MNIVNKTDNWRKTVIKSPSMATTEEFPPGEVLIRDIKHYEREIEQIGQPKNPHQKGMLVVYKTLLLRRQQMLAALRDDTL